MSDPTLVTEVEVYEALTPANYVIITSGQFAIVAVMPTYTDKIIIRRNQYVRISDVICPLAQMVVKPTTRLICKLYLEVLYEPYVEVTDGRTRHYLRGERHRIDGPAVYKGDDKEWYIDGKRHREGDLPAIERTKDGKSWWINDKRHREGDKPAVEYANGTKEWFIDGKRHREGDKPAIEYTNGTKEWHIDNKCHREGDKPAVENASGTKEWFIDNKRHREGDKPAIEYANGDKRWYINGKLHREGGPAIVDGDTERYFIDDNEIVGKALITLIATKEHHIDLPGAAKNARVEQVDGRFRVYFTL